jgi:hypothetical protein
MNPRPTEVSIRTYQVGFGDCFLFSIAYDDTSARHLLFDFGSTSTPRGSRNRMMQVAKDIAERASGKLTAVIATHRHRDHISGFDPGASNKGTGAVIASLKPDLVVQPWTEDPHIPTDAIGPRLNALPPAARGAAAQATALRAMHEVARGAVAESARSPHFPPALRRELRFIGEDNLKNLEAVKNLASMGPNEYVHFGFRSRLEALLPGVRVHVLGPPTVDQSADVANQRARNPAEYWHLQARALAAAGPAAAGEARGDTLFPDHVAARPPNIPIEARWLVKQARKMRGDHLLRLVRTLDDAMNNTSVILLMEIGDKAFLFPGDAQGENWAYALSKPEICEILARVNVYKVGHHGSLNATPKTLWNSFQNRSDVVGERLISLMSTLGGKHGHAQPDGHGTEVPRETLVKELRRDSDLVDTEAFADGCWFEDTVVSI